MDFYRAVELAELKWRPKRGRPPISNRGGVEGLMFVLMTGIPWKMLPRQVGWIWEWPAGGVRDWQKAGVWNRLHKSSGSAWRSQPHRPDKSRDRLDRFRSQEGEKAGKNPTDRGKAFLKPGFERICLNLVERWFC